MTTLHTFAGTDGAYPESGLLLDSDGNFYGTTSGNSATNDGTVFKITAAGVFSNLHTFAADTSGTYGGTPVGGLIEGGSAANLYGTTSGGGANSAGTIFRITTSGTLTSLYTFTDSTDGSDPLSSLFLNGTTFFGTTNGGSTGYGSVYEVNSVGSFQYIYDFTGGDDGGDPTGSVILGGDGNLYGTATNDGADGYGTIYQITTSGTLAVVHTFTGGDDGANPTAALLKPGDGYFYGITQTGGANGSGTVFRVTTTGEFTTLYTFSGGTDGAAPAAALVLGGDGALYGTTTAGGTYSAGTVFKITTAGAFTSLYSFTGGSDGSVPEGSLVEGSDGGFYGTTRTGGANGDGTVFVLSIHASFFDDEVALANGVYYLAFPGGNYFGYYSFLTGSNYIFHFDLGYEYVFDANDGASGVYLYDFASSDFFYTSPTFPFPYLYDFDLQSVLYYYPNVSESGRYTTNPRYFYNFADDAIITK